MHSDPLNLIRIIPVQEALILYLIKGLRLKNCSLFFYRRDKMITVNGEELDFSGNISGLLDVLEYNGKRVAVELNENIVPKSEYDNTIISDGDKLEIVRFVGGG